MSSYKGGRSPSSSGSGGARAKYSFSKLPAAMTTNPTSTTASSSVSLSTLPANKSALDSSEFLSETNITEMKDRVRELSALATRNEFLEAQLAALQRLVEEKEAQIKHTDERLKDIKKEFDDFRIKSSKIAAAAERYKEQVDENKALIKKLETESYEILTLIKSKYDKRCEDIKIKYENEITDLKIQLEDAKSKANSISTNSMSTSTSTLPKRPLSPSKGNKQISNQSTANDWDSGNGWDNPPPTSKQNSNSGGSRSGASTPAPQSPKKPKRAETKSAQETTSTWGSPSNGTNASPRSTDSWGCGVNASTSVTSLPLAGRSCSGSCSSSNAPSNDPSVNLERLNKVLKDLESANDQLAIAKTEIRISERESKRQKETTDMFRERNTELRLKLAELESQIRDLKSEVDEKQRAFEELRRNRKTVDERVSSLTSKHESEKIALEERVKRLEEKCKAFREVETGMASWKSKYEESRRESELNGSATRRLRAENERLQSELIALKDKVVTKEVDLKKITKSHDVLKSVSRDMSLQVDEYKRVCDELVAAKDEALREVATLKREAEIANNRIGRLKTEIEEMNRNFKATLHKEEDDMIRLRAELDLERLKIGKVNEQMTRSTVKIEELQTTISALEMDIRDKEDIIRDYDSQMDEMHSQLIAVKEEAAKNITNLTVAQQANERLMLALQDGMNENKNLEDWRFFLDGQMKQIQDSHRKEKTRLEETTNQQAKLINFLETKVNNKPKKKFGFLDRILQNHRGNKAQGGDSKSGGMIAPPARDLTRESALERENKRLSDLLERYRLEIDDLKARAQSEQDLRNELLELESQNEDPIPPVPRPRLTQLPLLESIRERTHSGRLEPSQRNHDIRNVAATNYDHNGKDISPIEEEEFTFSDSILNDIQNDDDDEVPPRYRANGPPPRRYNSRSSAKRPNNNYI